MFAGYRRLIAASIGLLLLTGCTSKVDAQGSAPPVTVHRMGGIAGVDDTVSIAADGTWTHGDRTGRLTEEQAKQVRELAADPRLEAESKRQAGESRCRDAFTFEVTVGDRVRVHYVDCPGDPDPPLATMALVEYLYGVVET